jgi:hypothetical protein
MLVKSSTKKKNGYLRSWYPIESKKKKPWISFPIQSNIEEE